MKTTVTGSTKPESNAGWRQAGRRLALHPFLAGAYAVVALLAHNIAQVELSDARRALGLTLLASAAGMLLFWAGLKDWRRAAVATTLAVVLFFTYGHIYQNLEANPIFGMNLGRHRLLAPFWLGMLIFGLYWAGRRLKDLDTATLALNLVFGLALLQPLLQLAVFGIRVAAAEAQQSGLPGELAQLELPGEAPPPDIYWIVLDAYARHDALAQVFDYDNSAFVSELEALGFYVAPCSQSNYAQTELSLTSTLNLNYLEHLGVESNPASADRSQIYPLLRQSAARRALERLGYRFVAFDSNFYRTQIQDADVYLSPATQALGSVNGLEVMLMQTSAGLLLSDTASTVPGLLSADVEGQKQEQHRAVIRYTLAELGQVPEAISGPKFVFVHILAPHEPYVFGPAGQPVRYAPPLAPQDEIEAYRGQVEFLNRQILPVIHQVIANSDVPPVIVIQGDHGANWASEDGRMQILNALYLPGVGEEALYASITPVNTFRVIFDHYFGGNLGRLEDHSYFSVYEKPFNYHLVPNECAP